MSLLPSFSDIFLTILIVIPGYASVKIIRKIGGLKKSIADKDLLYTSLVYSMFIYFIYSFIFKINDYESLKIELLKPYNIPKMLFITFMLSIILGAISYIIRKYLNITVDDCWKEVIDEYHIKYDKDVWVIVYTSDGKEYKGRIGYYGIKEDDKEITIQEPYRILRDTKFKLIEDVYLGDEMLFIEKDILRILFLEQKKNANNARAS